MPLAWPHTGTATCLLQLNAVDETWLTVTLDAISLACNGRRHSNFEQTAAFASSIGTGFGKDILETCMILRQNAPCSLCFVKMHKNCPSCSMLRSLTLATMKLHDITWNINLVKKDDIYKVEKGWKRCVSFKESLLYHINHIHLYHLLHPRSQGLGFINCTAQGHATDPMSSPASLPVPVESVETLKKRIESRPSLEFLGYAGRKASTSSICG